MKVIIQDSFWSPIRETVRREGIRYQWEALNDRIPDAAPSYCMRNFRIAAGLESGHHGGCVFQDSDVAKWLEGVAFSLRWHPDPDLEKIADEAIALIVSAQQPDGYMDTFYIINGLEKRWSNLRDNHELYCAGHMLEAAVAYFRVTGKRVLLDAMIRYVDHIDSVFGPGESKKHGYPGHPVIEMALMRLYEITRDPKHLNLARYFINERGTSPLYFEEEGKASGNRCGWNNGHLGYQYYQAGKPVREQRDAEGHSVRAMYLYSGMADVARETGDESLIQACRNLWKSTVHRRMYITGAIGSSEYGESFTYDYDLPNDTVYGETCASIGLVFFARRMLALEDRGEYADAMERALYNGILSGMQLDGKKFFYVNPLEVLPLACEKDHNKRHVKYERQKWFGCACCPPNLIRLLLSLEDYIVHTRGDALFCDLYASGSVSADPAGTGIRLETRTGYPWDGNIRISIDADRPALWTLALRVPSWSKTFAVRVNGETQAVSPDNGYVRLSRVWKTGDTVELELDMSVRFVRANPRIREDIGKIAVTRGPVVYCAEQADNGEDLQTLHVNPAGPVRVTATVLPGIPGIDVSGRRDSLEGWDDTLYDDRPIEQSEAAAIHLIPYYAWCNRGAGEMRVWLNA